MKSKNLMTAFATLALAAAMTMTTWAAGWQQNANGWWWENTDGTRPVNTWQWIDGNNDGVAECYYFDVNGYMVANTMQDGYTINGEGAWTVNSVVQTQGTRVNDSTNTLNSDNGGYNSYGCSISAIDILHHSREENAKYGEIKVEDHRVGLAVTYANGFIVGYPYTGTSTYKTVEVAPDRSDLNGSYLFKYYNASLSVNEAANMLRNNGFGASRDDHYAYAIGTTCRAHVAEGADINWGEKYILLR